MPTKKSTAIAPNTAQPCRSEPVIRPSVYVSPGRDGEDREHLQQVRNGVGFS